MNIILILTVMISFLTESSMIQFLSLLLNVTLQSLIIYYYFNSPMMSYYIFLAIVGGLMVLLSFVMMFTPNQSIQTSLFSGLFMIISMSLLIENIMTKPNVFFFMKMNQSLNQFYMDLFLIYPFMSVYLFMISFLLLMLFIVDGIIKVEEGSMILK